MSEPVSEAMKAEGAPSPQTSSIENTLPATKETSQARKKRGPLDLMVSGIMAVMLPPQDKAETSGKSYVVENQTARPLQIEPNEKSVPASLIIAPFGTRRLPEGQYDSFNFQPWKDHGLILVSSEKQPNPRKLPSLAALRALITVAVLLLAVSALGLILATLLFPLQNEILSSIGQALHLLYPLFLLGLILAVLLLGTAYLSQRPNWSRQSAGALALSVVAVSVIVVAAIGPALIMMSFIPGTQGNENITGRMMQMVFVVIAALLPALLYFLYDRQKVSIVSKTFYREIVRLDPTLHTSVDAEQKYGHLINEVYGDKSAGYYLANVGLPITLSSVLIALGWLLLLLPVVPNPTGLGGFFNINLDKLSPPVALSFGFLGAYFFAINMVFRRYVRSDLTPKAYSHITVRLLVTTVLVWAVSVLPVFQSNPQTLLILAFCIGVVPETAIRVIQEFMRKTVGGFGGLEERDPLTLLEGIDLYDRARLSEEGVENIENLAYHNFINLLVQTRIPARRLADMVDQAILYLHVRDSVQAAQETDKKSDDQVPLALKYLRGYGIRTATDLLYFWRRNSEPKSSALVEALEKESSPLAPRINFIVGTLKEADWVLQLLYRRALVTQLPDEAVKEPAHFFEKETQFAIELVKDLIEYKDTEATLTAAEQNLTSVTPVTSTATAPAIATPTTLVTATVPVPVPPLATTSAS